LGKVVFPRSRAFWAVAMLFLLMASVTLISFPSVSAQPDHWWDDGYYYRNQVDVTNNMAGAALPAGYPVKLEWDTATLVGSGDMQADGDDLRVIYLDSFNNSIELDRHLIDMNTGNTQIWFQTYAEIPAGDFDDWYYVYYKNPSAVDPPADWNKVFIPPNDANVKLLFHFEDGSGSHVTDTSGNGNNGWITGTPSWTEGRFGTGLEFNGLTNYILIFDHNSLDITDAITIEAYINPDTTNDHMVLLFKQYPKKDGVYSLCVTKDGKLQFTILSGFKLMTVKGKTTITPNVWQHVAGTFDGSTMRVYLNGQLDGSRNYSGNIDTSNEDVSLGSNPGTFFFDGVMDGARLSNVARASFPYAEVTDDPSAVFSGPPVPIPEIPIGPIAIVALGLVAFLFFKRRSSSSSAVEGSGVTQL